MSESTVALIAMRQEGHFASLLPLVSGLAGRGARAVVLTDREFAPRVERAGGRFVDLFAGRPVEAVDDESLPAPCRYVTFAGRHGADVARELEELGAELVIHDAHAPVGRVAAGALGIPHVSVCPAHNVHPARVEVLVRTLPVVKISQACREAVEVLRRRFGLHDASPFAFASWLSPHLNIYGEPPAFLGEQDRRALEPVAFNGCLPASEGIEAASGNAAPPYFGDADGRLRLYVCFGTVVWRYYPAEARQALEAIARSVAQLDGVAAVLSVGGSQISEDPARELSASNVSVRDYVDQWRILGEADAFVTHNGLKSTHEAIFNLVPMISYPFFWDQPALANRCRQLEVAVPLAASPLAPLRSDDLAAALSELSKRRESLRTGLKRARRWEEELLAGREHVIDRILALTGASR
jgi:MGT family glycosyltransferase